MDGEWEEENEDESAEEVSCDSFDDVDVDATDEEFYTDGNDLDEIDEEDEADAGFCDRDSSDEDEFDDH